MITAKSAYMKTALKPKELKLRAKEALKGVQFDTIVGTGLSGILPLYLLGEQFKVYTLAVRKPNDSSHAGSQLLEGTLGNRWLFLDDFISTGDTFIRTHRTVEKYLYFNNCNKAKCVGAFLYDELEDVRWTPFGDIPERAASVKQEELKEICG